MKLKYTGEHATVAFGISFAPGETKDIPDDATHAQKKLQGNPFFEEVKDKNVGGSVGGVKDKNVGK